MGFEFQTLATGDSINRRECLVRGARLTSANNRFTLIHQFDGNVVLYDKRYRNRPLWHTRTAGIVDPPTTSLKLMSDGDLKLFCGSRCVWSTRTADLGAAYLRVQNDGNVCLYAVDGLVWSSDTWQPGWSHEVEDFFSDGLCE